MKTMLDIQSPKPEEVRKVQQEMKEYFDKAKREIERSMKWHELYFEKYVKGCSKHKK